MLNKYFISIFNTTSDGDNIDRNDINANAETKNALADSQDPTTEPNKNNNDNSNGSVSNNNNENTQVLNRQNCIQEKCINVPESGCHRRTFISVQTLPLCLSNPPTLLAPLSHMCSFTLSFHLSSGLPLLLGPSLSLTCTFFFTDSSLFILSVW